MKKLLKIIKDHIASLLFVFLIILAYLVIKLSFHPSLEPAVAINTLNNLQKTAIDIIVEMNKLIISFSLLIIGGLGGIIIHRYKDIKLRSMSQIIIIILSMTLASLSIYFGYILYFKIVEMLSNNIFDPYNNMIVKPQQYQYYSFLLSLILFALFVISNATQKIKEKANREIENEPS